MPLEDFSRQQDELEGKLTCWLVDCTPDRGRAPFVVVFFMEKVLKSFSPRRLKEFLMKF